MKTYRTFITEQRQALFKKDQAKGAKMLADSTPKDFDNDYHQSGTAKFIGQTANTPKKVAAIAQVARNPHYETFHFLYTKGNKVVGHTAVSNRLPAQVQMFKDHRDQVDTLSDAESHMKHLGADGYWMIHNHPSGNSEPSEADHNLTNFYKEHLPGLRGHVIVNHHTFSSIHPNSIGTHKTFEINSNKTYDLTHHTMPHDSTNKTITSPKDVAEVAKQFQNPNHATIIGVKSTGHVGAVAHMPLHLLTGKTDAEKTKSLARVRNFIKMTGSGMNTVISVPSTAHVMGMRHLYEKGVALDIVPHDKPDDSAMRMGYTRTVSDNKDLGGSVKFHRQEHWQNESYDYTPRWDSEVTLT